MQYIVAHFPVQRLQFQQFGFDIAKDSVGLCWFLNPEDTGETKPEMGIAIENE